MRRDASNAHLAPGSAPMMRDLYLVSGGTARRAGGSPTGGRTRGRGPCRVALDRSRFRLGAAGMRCSKGFTPFIWSRPRAAGPRPRPRSGPRGPCPADRAAFRARRDHARLLREPGGTRSAIRRRRDRCDGQRRRLDDRAARLVHARTSTKASSSGLCGRGGSNCRSLTALPAGSMPRTSRPSSRRYSSTEGTTARPSSSAAREPCRSPRR
jgi:hypothetical protein